MAGLRRPERRTSRQTGRELGEVRGDWAAVGQAAAWSSGGNTWLWSIPDQSLMENKEGLRGLGRAGLGRTTRWCSCAALAFKGAAKEI